MLWGECCPCTCPLTAVLTLAFLGLPGTPPLSTRPCPASLGDPRSLAQALPSHFPGFAPIPSTEYAHHWASVQATLASGTPQHSHCLPAPFPAFSLVKLPRAGLTSLAQSSHGKVHPSQPCWRRPGFTQQTWSISSCCLLSLLHSAPALLLFPQSHPTPGFPTVCLLARSAPSLASLSLRKGTMLSP